MRKYRGKERKQTVPGEGGEETEAWGWRGWDGNGEGRKREEIT